MGKKPKPNKEENMELYKKYMNYRKTLNYKLSFQEYQKNHM